MTESLGLCLTECFCEYCTSELTGPSVLACFENVVAHPVLLSV